MLETESDLAYKVLDMIQDQTNYAVPVASIRARTTLIGSTKPGSGMGILARSFAMYKSFPVTFMQRNIMAAITQKGAPRKASIAGDLLISSTILAAFAIQMREVAKGRDPRDMTDERFWGAAMLSSGGLGIWGDFLFSGRNRFGGGLTETIAGPQIGFLNDLANFFGRYLPGNSLWYARLGFERSVLDRLREWTDPEAAQKFRRIERKRQREYGQEYFWRPGELTPERSPDIQAVTGE
jgi:hypothetical protein